MLNKLNQISAALFRSPLLWGAMLTVGFYAPIEAGILNHPEVLRYFAGHWVEYVETGMFFVGLSALAIKALDVSAQLGQAQRPLLPPIPSGGQPASDCAYLLEFVASKQPPSGPSYLSRRLTEALRSIHRKGSAETLDADLKYLSELDAARVAQSYAFIRIVIWAIPILGFLGTVIGITMSIANLNPKQLEQSLPEVTGGLGVAFDTTALALALSIVLMFTQFLVDKLESRLLAEVDDRASAELLGRFRGEMVAHDPLMLAVRRMVDAILPNTDRLVARQAELWRSTIDAAHSRWSELTAASGQRIEAALAGALDTSLKAHSQRLIEAEQSLAEASVNRWGVVQQSLEKTSAHLATQQMELRRQGEILLKVVEATDQISQLETTLNRNLQSLAGAKNFEETVVSLAAAIQLLSARLGSLPAGDVRSVDLSRPKHLGHAA